MTRSVLTRLRPRRPPRWLLAGILWGLAPFLAYPAERAEPKEAPRPEAIRTDGVPPVPLELLDGLRRYQEIRPSTFIDWAPGGGLLVSKRLTKVHQLYHVGEPLGNLVQLTGGSEPASYGRYLPDGGLIFSRAKGGDENYQIYHLPSGESEARLLTDGKSRNLLGPSDRAGGRAAFTSNRRNGRDEDLYILDLREGGEPRLVLEVKGESWGLSDWSEDGKRALLFHFISAGECYGHLCDLSTLKREPLPDEMQPARAGKPARARRQSFRFGPGSKSVYFLSDARGEFLELARLDLESRQYAWLTRDIPWDVEELEISPDGRLGALLVNADGTSRLYTVRLEELEKEGERAAAKAREEIPLRRGLASGLRFAPDSKGLGFSLASVSSPSEAASYSFGSKELTSWTTAAGAGFEPEEFDAPELFRYESFDRSRIPAFVFWPRRAEGVPAGKIPVVIHVHGGPESQFRPSFSVLRQYLVRELGIAVIAPNVRGSTGYGKTFTSLDDGKSREDSVRDIGALLDWIGKQEKLDSSRVAIIGGSYGGYMVLASLVHYGERIRAGVDVVGISSFATFLKNTSPYRQDLRRVEYGDERDPGMLQFFEKISPANQMHRLKSALFVIHGANDPRVPLSEAERIVSRARATGRPVWSLYADNEGHGFRRRENTDYQEAATVMFLQRFLLGTE